MPDQLSAHLKAFGVTPSSSASDLAAARERLTQFYGANGGTRSDPYPAIAGRSVELQCAVHDADILTLIEATASLGDGDDSARLDALQAMLRPLPWGGVYALLESDGDSQFRLTIQPSSGDAPFVNETGPNLRACIDAARTAPGGESNGA